MEVELKKDERIDDLEYKNLKIIQNKKGFCFGLDAVLLSDFAKGIKKGSNVLDLGTGTGILGILLCGKTNLGKIVGVEIQKDVYDMAKRSIKLNDLEDRFSVINEDIKELDKKLELQSFDAIVTNPPYKKINTGLENSNEYKMISRHEVKCNVEDIVRVASKLLKNNGILYMVHRPERIKDIILNLEKYKMQTKEIRFVHPNITKKPNMILIKAVKGAGDYLNVGAPLFVYNLDGTYNSEILKIYEKEDI